MEGLRFLDHLGTADSNLSKSTLVANVSSKQVDDGQGEVFQGNNSVHKQLQIYQPTEINLKHKIRKLIQKEFEELNNGIKIPYLTTR